MKIGNFEISKKILIAFIVILVLAITAFIVKKKYIKDYNKYKIDDEQEFIYTYKTYDNSNTAIPYVNIDTDFAKELNEKIQKLGELYKDSNTSNNSMTYGYDIKDNIVSLVLTFKELNSENQLVFSFVTYVFDLDENGRALTNEEILKKYNLTEEKVDEEITYQMVKKYDDEINKKIIPETCDFKQCFQNLRKVNKYTDDAHYYIEKGWLVVYKSYNVFSEYKEETYFTRDDFKFYITGNKK